MHADRPLDKLKQEVSKKERGEALTNILDVKLSKIVKSARIYILTLPSCLPLQWEKLTFFPLTREERTYHYPCRRALTFLI